MSTHKKPIGIYIHWPYCLSKCPYCDFFSEVKPAAQDQIITNYLEDLNFYHNLTSEQTVASIFFGGGTPSLIKPKNIDKLINHIHQKWHIANNIEISLEANPNTQQDFLFSSLHQAGINRLSLGIQALNEPDLKFLGRSHSLQQALTSITQVLKTFDNHSIDLIYARPHQKLADWAQELQQATQFGFKHLSLYQLTIEPNTPFGQRNVLPLAEDEAVQMYELTRDYLSGQGYEHYEVSNFAQPGFCSIHNLGYWQGRDYIGIGPSAHGRISHSAQGSAHPDLANTSIAYATTHHRILEPLTASERATELLLMGLRLTQGLSKSDFKTHCGLDLKNFINTTKLQELKTNNLVLEDQTHLRATASGMLVLNKIIEDLLP